MNSPAPDTESIFIVGAGPAGLATAILARQKGFRVTVADQARPAIDKACGEGLLPDTVAAVAAMGITFQGEEAMPFRGIRFLDAAGPAKQTLRFSRIP